MLVTSGRVDGGHCSLRIVDALMKGNLNPEGERICPPLGESNDKPDQGVVGFSNPELDAYQCAGTGSQLRLQPNRRWLEWGKWTNG
jgi:hypothetical protein